MKDSLEDKLLNPRPGSKVAAAKEFGVDLTLLLKNLRLTPQQRIDQLQRVMRFHHEMRKQSSLNLKNKKA